MEEQIQTIRNEALSQIIASTSIEEIDTLKINYLGRKGKINLLLDQLKLLPKTQKRTIGQLINDTRNAIENSLTEQKRSIKSTVSSTTEWFDPTVSGLKPPLGHLHLVTKAIEEITEVFNKIGFSRVRYPEVEWDWYAFEGLNMPENHPARDEWETFFVESPKHSKHGKMILTPHTSSGQIREMERIGKPPIRMINIAKCYRRQSDASHLTMFHQFEGLVIDREINITHLKGTIDYFTTQFYGTGRITRLRPYHFQFTEPSFEVDVTCGVCLGRARLPDGQGCKLCKAGWLELGGAGMVHPNVLKAGGIDPQEYSGFAFGWGVERTYMMKSGLKMEDIRTLYSTDLRYLRQF